MRAEKFLHINGGKSSIKKLLALLLAAMMCLSLAACGGTPDAAADNAPSSPAVNGNRIEISMDNWSEYFIPTTRMWIECDADGKPIAGRTDSHLSLKKEYAFVDGELSAEVSFQIAPRAITGYDLDMKRLDLGEHDREVIYSDSVIGTFETGYTNDSVDLVLAHHIKPWQTIEQSLSAGKQVSIPAVLHYSVEAKAIEGWVEVRKK